MIWLAKIQHVIFPAGVIINIDIFGRLSNMVKIISWYDNEMGYSTRLAETLKMVAEKL